MWAQSQLSGFRMRAVRAESPSQRHMYATKWVQVDVKNAVAQQNTTLLVSDDDLVGNTCLRTQATADELARKAQSQTWSTLVAYAATQGSTLAVLPLFALEGAPPFEPVRV